MKKGFSTKTLVRGALIAATYATLPTVFANALIVPFVIMYAYGSPESYWFLFVTVAAGELVTATGVGTLLYYQLEKRKFLYGL